MLVLGVVFTIVVVVEEAIILRGFSQIGKGSFPSPFMVVCHEGHREV
jgi:hypothetical protein